MLPNITLVDIEITSAEPIYFLMACSYDSVATSKNILLIKGMARCWLQSICSLTTFGKPLVSKSSDILITWYQVKVLYIPYTHIQMCSQRHLPRNLRGSIIYTKKVGIRLKAIDRGQVIPPIKRYWKLCFTFHRADDDLAFRSNTVVSGELSTESPTPHIPMLASPGTIWNAADVIRRREGMHLVANRHPDNSLHPYQCIYLLYFSIGWCLWWKNIQHLERSRFKHPLLASNVLGLQPLESVWLYTYLKNRDHRGTRHGFCLRNLWSEGGIFISSDSILYYGNKMLEPERILKLIVELPYCINKQKGPSYHISQGSKLHKCSTRYRILS